MITSLKRNFMVSLDGWADRFPRATAREEILAGLTRELHDSVIEADAFGTKPDLLVQLPNGIALVEIKTGDPALPLPSSTDAQMNLLTSSLASRYPWGKKLIPVVVTNYRVYPDQKAALETAGIRIVSVRDYSDSKKLASALVQVAGER
jgi:hypothetical protein